MHICTQASQNSIFVLQQNFAKKMCKSQKVCEIKHGEANPILVRRFESFQYQSNYFKWVPFLRNHFLRFFHKFPFSVCPLETVNFFSVWCRSLPGFWYKMKSSYALIETIPHRFNSSTQIISSEATSITISSSYDI